MNGNKERSGIHLAGLRFLVITLLVLGVFFRFANLDLKVYWGDEVYTSLRLAGYTLKEAVQELFDGQPKSFEELQQYQRPQSEKGIIPSIKALAIEDSQHPPLYYTIAWFWEQWFGSAIAVRRTLPALISLLVFPCLYGLCWELFESPLVGWVAVALVAVSPFHVLYAQEVREYSLWTVTILLSSWALLRSLRLNTKKSWAIYAATLVLGLYTYLFSVLIASGHIIYVFAIEKGRISKRVTAFLLASGFGFITFAPWLFYVANNLSTIQTTTSLLEGKVPLLSLWEKWGFNLSRAFIDLDSQGRIIPIGNSLTEVVRNTLVITLVILVGYAIYFLCRHTPQRIWLFVLTLMGITGMSLILPDLIFGGIRSSATRYLVPCYLGIQVAVAYLLATRILGDGRRYLWRLVAIALLSAGVVSCVISSPAETWWNKYGSYYNPQVAKIINQAQRPLLISSGYLPRVLSLSYLLQPKVSIQFVEPANLSQIPEGFSDVFFYRPGEELQSRLTKHLKYKIEKIYQSPPVFDYLEPISQHSEIWISKLVKRY